MARVQLSKVSKSFGATKVLDDVNLEIDDGEFVVFVGPSGCGKSTLLRIIAGLEDVSSGEVRIDGQLVNDASPKERGVAMVFQSYALYPQMSVYENMAFALRLAKTPDAEIDAAVRAAAEKLAVAHLLDRKPKDLSGGQRQRVAIGRSIVRKPKVFLFDEPLSNLDATLRVRMRYEFAKLHQDLAATMIYVTHDQVEAMTLAEKLVVLSAGKVMQIGAPLELYNKPANRFVAEFIGSPRMNFFAGEVAASSAREGLDVKLRTGEVVRVAAAPIAAGEKITLGLRPEHFVLADDSGSAVRGVVRFVERLGATNFAYVQAASADNEIVVQLPGDAVCREGDEVSLGLPAGAAHLFDAHGEAIGAAASP